MSSISSTTSSYDVNSLWNQLNSISKNAGTTANYFSTSIARSNLNSSIISEFDSSSNVSNNPFYEIVSECSSLKNGTVKTNINSFVKNSSSSSTNLSASASMDSLDTSTTIDSSSTSSTSTSSSYNYASILEDGSNSGSYISTFV